MTRQKRKRGTPGALTQATVQENVGMQGIKRALGSALAEDAGDIEAFSASPPVEELRLEEAPASKKRRGAVFKRRFYMVLGAFVLIMSVVGFVSTVSFGVRLVKDVVNNTALKTELASFIYPLVVIDPPPFDDKEQLQNSTVLTAAIWNIMLSEEKKSRYTAEGGMIAIPAIDVEASAAELFGKGFSYEHQSLGDVEMFFAYDADTKSYTAPVSPRYLPYSPRVVDLSETGDIFRLTVDYIPPGPAWINADSDYVTSAVKQMEYVVERFGNTYKVIAVNYIDTAGLVE